MLLSLPFQFSPKTEKGRKKTVGRAEISTSDIFSRDGKNMEDLIKMIGRSLAKRNSNKFE